MTHHITITYAYGIDRATGRVNSEPQATFSHHGDAASDEFLRRNVRGYRGPMHPVVAAVYATLAAAAGFKVEVKHSPKPAPDQIKAVLAHFKNGGKS
jgi:hypothetical protein